MPQLEEDSLERSLRIPNLLESAVIAAWQLHQRYLQRELPDHEYNALSELELIDEINPRIHQMYREIEGSRTQRAQTVAEQHPEPVRRPRVHGGSPEEVARRRRRREAMVLNEGDRPVSERDIIQRRRTDEMPRGMVSPPVRRPAVVEESVAARDEHAEDENAGWRGVWRRLVRSWG